MKPSNCRKCGKLFIKTVGDICPECIKKEQETLQNVIEYCQFKDVVTLDEISKDLEVPVSKLEKFLLDRKLVQIMDKLEITCKNCGKVFRIETLGTLYCPNCRPLMENKLGRTF